MYNVYSPDSSCAIQQALRYLLLYQTNWAENFYVFLHDPNPLHFSNTTAMDRTPPNKVQFRACSRRSFTGVVPCPAPVFKRPSSEAWKRRLLQNLSQPITDFDKCSMPRSRGNMVQRLPLSMSHPVDSPPRFLLLPVHRSHTPAAAVDRICYSGTC